MTLAAVAPVSSNETKIWVVLALLAVLAICAVLYQHERRSDHHGTTLAAHAEQLATLAYQMPALLDWLGVEITPPVADDSPGHEAELYEDTEEIPIAPATVPDGMPLAVQSALIEQRPSPVPRKSADWVEEAIKGFDFSGRNR